MSTTTETDSLKIKYREVLVGYEKYSFTEEQLREAEFDFELALPDLKACQACNGDLCRTIINRNCNNPYWHAVNARPCTDECYPLTMRAYYGLHHEGCGTYERPSFAVNKCPGVEKRKEQLVGQMRARWYDR